MTEDISTARSKVDPFQLEIIRSHLTTTCQEMGLAMMRTSYSTIFNEALDFSCVLFDRRGEMIAMGDFCPAQLGAIGHVVEWCIKEIGPENMLQGDVYLHNDPYRGGCHLPEFMVLKPLFIDGHIEGYTASIAHMIDVGGTSAGGFGVTESIFQEGLRLPPVRIYAGDEEVRDILRIIISNVRTPQHSYGDLKALIGSLYLAERRLRELISDYGLETFRDACEAIKDASETMVRRAIAAMALQECSFEGFIEDDGVERDSCSAIRGRIVVMGDEMIVDFTGSSSQAKGQTNQTFGVTASATYAAAFFAIGDALGVQVPFNHGAFRPISVIAPPGTFVNVLYPGACLGGNSDSSPTTVDTLLAAFAKMLGKSAAADGGTLGILVMSGADERTGDLYTNLHFDGSGWGASWNHDGNSVQVGKTSNCANTPVEILETRYPIRCEEYRFNLSRLGAPGAGRFRGGFGCRRIFTVLGQSMTLSAHFNRTEVKPWGIEKGDDGGNSLLAFKLAGSNEWRTSSVLFGTISNGKFRNVLLHKGDQILVEIGGGGGYGDPLSRDPVLVLQDWNDEFMDADTARERYGVVLSDASRTVDLHATHQLRRERADA